jgi:mannosyl-3-phosphoglycerate phosphatase
VNPKLVIFTDLDGTLLDHQTYSYEEALPAVTDLKQRDIPIVFCSSKTRSEQEVYCQELGLSDPFIVENGGAIFIRQGYFPFSFDFDKAEDGYQIIELGIPYQEIRWVLKRIRSEIGLKFKGFGDMSAREVAKYTGLTADAARLAKKRAYGETLELDGSPAEIEGVLRAVKEAGLNYSFGGQCCDITGPNNKGRAVTILTELFCRKLGQVMTIALGDSPNDLSMLSVVDVPILVQKPDGVWQETDLRNLHRIEGIGPAGWAKAISEILPVYN